MGAAIGVAAVAADASCEHACALMRAHGEAGVTARLVPLRMDGLVGPLKATPQSPGPAAVPARCEAASRPFRMLLPLGRAIVPCMSQQPVAIPPFTAQMAEQVCKVLADAVTAAQIPNLLVPVRFTEVSADGQLAKWKRLFNAVAAKQNAQQDGLPLIRLVSEIMTPVRFASPAEFNAVRVQAK